MRAERIDEGHLQVDEWHLEPGHTTSHCSSKMQPVSSGAISVNEKYFSGKVLAAQSIKVGPN